MKKLNCKKQPGLLKNNGSSSKLSMMTMQWNLNLKSNKKYQFIVMQGNEISEISVQPLLRWFFWNLSDSNKQWSGYMNVFIYLSGLASSSDETSIKTQFNQNLVFFCVVFFFALVFVDCVEIHSLVEQKRDAGELFDDATKTMETKMMMSFQIEIPIHNSIQQECNFDWKCRNAVAENETCDKKQLKQFYFFKLFLCDRVECRGFNFFYRLAPLTSPRWWGIDKTSVTSFQRNQTGFSCEFSKNKKRNKS